MAAKTHKGAQCAFILGLALALAGLFALPASAYVLQPLAADLRASGTQSSATFRVTNDSDEPMPVEVKYKRLTLGETGGPVLSEAKGDEFIIFPPQVVIQPGRTQVFRVQWVADPALQRSASFMFEFAQVPVERPEGVTGIQVLYSLQSVVTVSPSQGSAQLRVVSAAPATTSEGKPGLEVTIANDSPVHGYFSRMRLQLNADASPGRSAWSRTFSTGELNSAIGLGLVPGGQQRKFVLPISDAPTGAVRGQLLRAESRR